MFIKTLKSGVMLEFIKEKKNCVGCTACYSVCPTRSIQMIEDEEGFLYPSLIGKCIQCGKCERVCPIHNMKLEEQTYKKKAYAGVTRDWNIWERSASGGAFSEICRAWGDNKTIIAGAAWGGLRVHHICVKGVNNISPLCKSKYIASNLEDTFIEIENYLQCGNKVLFCGTPCQVAGLKQFLGKEYTNLLLIDLICHGVGSPKIFNSCIKVIEKQLGCNISRYEFRSKKRKYEYDHIEKITLLNNKEVSLSTDPYIQLFLKQLCLRPSCGENCKYRNEHRQGDITIADFKGLKQVFPKLANESRNYSTIIINNNKGEKIISALEKSMILYECRIEDIKRYNPLFYRQTRSTKKRDEFFTDYINTSQDAIIRWTKPTEIHKLTIKRKIYNIIPDQYAKYIKNIIARTKT